MRWVSPPESVVALRSREKVAQPHPLEEVEALRDFRHYVTGNERFLPFKLPPFDQFCGGHGRQGGNVTGSHSLKPHGASKFI